MNLFKKNIANQSEELKAVNEKLEALNLEFDSVKEQLKTAEESAAHYQVEFVALNELFEELKAENEVLKADNAELASDTASLELKAAEVAADIVSEVMGADAVAITDDSESLSVLETFSTLKGKERIEFYNAHKQEIFKSLKH